MTKREARKIQKVTNNQRSSGSNDPMSPEKIASHEPTAVKRDKNQGTSGDPISLRVFFNITTTTKCIFVVVVVHHSILKMN